MKKVDVLFLYETKVRELESICLIKSELEKRGISVAVMNTWNNLGVQKPPYRASVVVTHGMYHDGIYLFVKDFCGEVPKVVNLQWEQIGQLSEETNYESRYVLKGIAKQCVHICWGNRTYRRLRDVAKIDEDHLALTGQVSMDFCRKELRGYFLPRKELLDRYGLDAGKTVNLFISSFSYVNLPKRFVDDAGGDANAPFIEFSVRSFQAIKDWLIRALEAHEDQIFIYRPHPAEAGNAELTELERRYEGRFKVISELSVKQWISASDRVYSWYSTAVADAYGFGIPVSILRPVPVPEGMEVALYENADFITDYERFEQTLNAQREAHSSIDGAVFDDLYFRDEGFAYLRVADTIEKVLRDDRYLIVDPPTLPPVSLSVQVKRRLSRALSAAANRLPASLPLLSRFRAAPQKPDAYTLERQKNNYASDGEIEAIQRRIKEAIRDHV